MSESQLTLLKHFRFGNVIVKGVPFVFGSCPGRVPKWCIFLNALLCEKCTPSVPVRDNCQKQKAHPIVMSVCLRRSGSVRIVETLRLIRRSSAGKAAVRELL